MNIASTVQMIVDNTEPYLDGPDRAEAERQVKELFIARIGVAVLEALTPEDRELYLREYGETHQQSSAQAQQFVRSRIPQMDDLVSREAQEMIKDFL